MTKLTKTAVTIATMNANADKPMADVIELIVIAQHAAGFADVTAKIAAGAYRWAVKNEKAIGLIPARAKAEPKAKAPKAAKKIAVATTKKARVVNTAAVSTKSADEIEAIRAANLEKIKAVHRKMIANGTLPNTLNEEIEEDKPVSVDAEMEIDRDHPRFLSRDDLDVIL